METQDAITIAYHRNNERGFRDALALTPRAERTTKDSQAAYDLGYEEGRKVRQSLVYNIQEAPANSKDFPLTSAGSHVRTRA